jgi:uncharacterized protein
MRSQGGWALTLECGQHQDPQAPEVAYRAMRRTLAQQGLVDEPQPAPAAIAEALSLGEVVDKVHTDDRFERPWQSFDAVAAGQTIGWRADGQAVCAPADGRLVFPHAQAQAGQEWFYFAQPSARFGGCA